MGKAAVLVEVEYYSDKRLEMIFNTLKGKGFEPRSEFIPMADNTTVIIRCHVDDKQLSELQKVKDVVKVWEDNDIVLFGKK